MHWRRWSGFPCCALPGGCRCGNDLGSSISTMSISQLCNGKFFTERRTSAAANSNLRATGCRTLIRRSKSNCMNAGSPAKPRSKSWLTTMWSSTDRIISPRAICPMTSASLRGSQMFTAQCFDSKGQTTVFAPHLGGPCYRCLFPEPPPPESVPNCAQAGVLGVLPGIIGMLQAIEAIKLIVGIGEPLIGRLLHFDALKVQFRELKLRRDPQCPVCGENPTIFAPIDYDQFCGARETERFLKYPCRN